jgi:hypothetical protein
MGHPELVKMVELHNADIVAGQIDIDSGSLADNVFNIALAKFSPGLGGAHA